MNTDPYLRKQYADATNINARISLHGRFQTNRYGWLRWIFDHFDLPPTCRILEVGCGTGVLWSANRSRIPTGWELTLTDNSPGMLDEARRNLADLGRPVTFQVVDAQQIPFPDARFDAIVADQMLYHMTDLNQALCEIRRVLRPAGRVYAATGGIDHMQEFRDLVRPFAPDLPFTQQTEWYTFSLANGQAQLERFFEDVRMDRYEDSLEVTETQPLLDYILSVRGAEEMLSNTAVAQIRRLIEERIASQGAFHITKSQGIFTGTRRPS